MLKFPVNLLKAYYGARATKENDFGYGWLPKLTKGPFPFRAGDMDMASHEIDGYLHQWGKTRRSGSQNARLSAQSLARVKNRLVVRDLVEIESASFWYDAPEIERGEMKTEDIATEVFLMPPPRTSRRREPLRTRSASSSGGKKPSSRPAMPRARRASTNSPSASSRVPRRRRTRWTNLSARSTGGYPEVEDQTHPGPSLAEISNWHTTAPEPEIAPGVVKSGQDGIPHHGKATRRYLALKDDGSTASGCWIYTGCYGSDEVNKCHRREPHGP